MKANDKESNCNLFDRSVTTEDKDSFLNPTEVKKLKDPN